MTGSSRRPYISHPEQPACAAWLSDKNEAVRGDFACVSCHRHSARLYVGRPEKNACELGAGTCHDAENSPRFDYEKHKEEIRHW